MPLVSCAPPNCHLTRPRKRRGEIPLPARCIRPNPWIVFLAGVGGKGYGRKLVSYMYGRWKRRWARENPGLSVSAARAKMNADLCRTIAERNRRAPSRESSASRAPSRKSSAYLSATRERRREIARERTARLKKAAETKKAAAARERRREIARLKKAAETKKAAATRERRREIARLKKAAETKKAAATRERRREIARLKKAAENKKAADEGLKKAAEDKKAADKRLKKAAEKNKAADKKKAGEEKASTSVFFAEKAVPRGWDLSEELKRLSSFEFHVGSGESKKSIHMKRNALQSMNPGQWLNDDVISAYMMLLQDRGNPSSGNGIFMTPLFYAKFTARPDDEGIYDRKYYGKSAAIRHPLVKRWTRKMNTTTGNVKIFVPVNHGNVHWTLIVIDVGKKHVVSIDSFNNDNSDARTEMLGWIEQEHIARKKPFNLKSWKTLKLDAPRQTNSYDCGAFTCMFAAYISNNKPLTFSQQDMKQMRARMMWSVLNKRL